MNKLLVICIGILSVCNATEKTKYPPLPPKPKSSASLPLPATPTEKKPVKKEEPKKITPPPLPPKPPLPAKPSLPPKPPLPPTPSLPIDPKLWQDLKTAIHDGKLGVVQDLVPSKITLYSVADEGKTPLELAEDQAQKYQAEEKLEQAIQVVPIIEYFNQLVASEEIAPPKEVVKKTSKAPKKLRFGQTHAVPKDLAGKVIYIQSVQQPKDACGYHSIINLWALQQLLAQGEVITSDTINTQFLEKETSEPLVCTKEVEIYQMIEFIGRNFPTLHDIFFIRFNAKSNTIQSVGCYPLTSKTDFNQYIEQLRYRTRPEGYFIANTGAHWVLMALVTIEDQPIVIYLNSMNSPLTTESHAYRILKELVRLLVL